MILDSPISTVDASTDAVSHVFTLANTVPTTTITGFAPADIIYTTGDISSLTIDTSAFGNQVMNIDMSSGNPIPFVGSPGLTFNAGADFGTPGSHAINIFGELPTGPFASEIHNANDPGVFPQIGQYGSIFFDDGQGSFSSLTSLNYTGLLPITDTTPAIDYTFNDFADDQSFSATDGPIVRRLPDDRIRQHAVGPAADLRDDGHRQQELRHIQHAGANSRHQRSRRRSDRHPTDCFPSPSIRPPAATIPSRSSTRRPASSRHSTAARTKTSPTSPVWASRPAPYCS